jgi:hypothetical protein
MGNHKPKIETTIKAFSATSYGNTVNPAARE